MSEEDNFPHKRCDECGEEFDSSFDLIDHLLPEDEEFNPYYILPNGFKLLLGSLLRFMYNNSHNPEQIELISQTTYTTLFAAEMGYDLVEDIIEEMVVASATQDLDEEFRKLLEKEEDGKQ